MCALIEGALAALKTIDDKDMVALVERCAEQKLTWSQASPPAGRRSKRIQATAGHGSGDDAVAGTSGMSRRGAGKKKQAKRHQGRVLLDQMVQSFCERASATAEERSGQERGSARQDGEMQRLSAGATDMIAVFLEGCKQGTRPIEKVQGRRGGRRMMLRFRRKKELSRTRARVRSRRESAARVGSQAPGDVCSERFQVEPSKRES